MRRAREKKERSELIAIFSVKARDKGWDSDTLIKQGPVGILSSRIFL